MGSPRQAAALLLAFVLVASAAAVVPVGTATAAPPGFVGVPSDDVEKSNVTVGLGNPPDGVLPDRAGPPSDVLDRLPNQALDHVIADRHAGTTIVQFATTKNDELALVATDDTFHEGRRIGVPVSALEQSLGYVPRLAFGIHEDGDRWRTEIEIVDGYALIRVPRFSTNTVTFSGTVTLTGSPATNGTAYSYDLTDYESVENFTIDVTGATATEWDNETSGGFVSPGSSQAVALAGNTEPGGPSANGKPELTVTVVDDDGPPHPDAGSYTYRSVLNVWGKSAGNPIKVEYTHENPPSTVHGIKIALSSVSTETATYDIYAHAGDWNNSVPDGTLVYDDYTFPTTTGNETILFTSPIDVPAGENITIEFDPVTITGGDNEQWGTASDNNAHTVFTQYTNTWNNIAEVPEIYVLDENATGVTASADDGTNADLGTTTGPTTVEFNITRAATTISANGTNAHRVEWSLAVEERVETVDPTIEVNGQTTSYTGTLADGSTVSLTANTSWLQTGTNRVNVTVGNGTLSADAPAPSVDLDYSHRAVDDVTVSYENEHLTERYNVSRTYGSDQTEAEVTIPFTTTVVEVRDVEKRVNGGSWTTVTSSSYTLDGTTLTVELGSVSANDTIDIKANGSRISCNSCGIKVLQATTAGSDLDSRVRLTSWGTESYIRVDTGGSGSAIHYTADESWGSVESHVVYTSGGEEQLYLPNAVGGSEFNLRTIPVEVTPDAGDVAIEVTDAAALEFDVSAGPDGFTDAPVAFKYTAATTGTDYILWSVTSGVVRDSGTASSPITLTDDDSPEILQIQVDSSGSSSGSGGGGGGGGSSGGSVIVSTSSTNPLNSLPIVLIAGVLSVAAVGFVSTRFIDDDLVVLALTSGAALIVLVVTGEGLNPGVILGPVGEGIGQVVPVLALAGGAFVLWLAYRRWIKGEEPPTIEIRGRVR